MCQSLYIKNIKFESITNYFSILSFVNYESDTMKPLSHEPTQFYK